MTKVILAALIVALGFGSANANMMPQQPTSMHLSDDFVFKNTTKPSQDSGSVPAVKTVSADSTAFAQLAEVFKTGTVPTQADLTGIHAGRICYSFDQVDAGVLFGVVGSKSGLPADLVPTAFYVHSFASPGSVHNRFENLSKAEKDSLNKLLIERLFDAPAHTSVEFGDQSASYEFDGMVINIRKHGKYLLMQARKKGNKTFCAYGYFELKAQ